MPCVARTFLSPDNQIETAIEQPAFFANMGFFEQKDANV